MDQIGVHMNFLQINQVLTFIYALKIDLCVYFLFSQVSGSGLKFQKAQGLKHKRNRDTERCTEWTTGSLVFPGTLMQKRPAKQYGGF
jgi:hypothetical protein